MSTRMVPQVAQGTVRAPVGEPPAGESAKAVPGHPEDSERPASRRDAVLDWVGLDDVSRQAGRRRIQRAGWVTVLIAADLLAFAAAIWVAAWSYQLPVFEGLRRQVVIPFNLQHIAGTTTFLAMLLACMAYYRLYQSHNSILYIREYCDIVRATIMALLLTGAIASVTRADLGSRIYLVLLAASAMFMLITGRTLLLRVHGRLYHANIGVSTVLICGAGEAGRTLARTLIFARTCGFRPLVFLDDSLPRGATVPLGKSTPLKTRVLGRLDDLPRVLRRVPIDEVFVALPEADDKQLARLTRQAEEAGKIVRYVPRVGLLQVQQMSADLIGDMILMRASTLKKAPVYEVLKRILDLAITIPLLILLSPLMVGIALIIRLTSPGPALFIQKRIGRRGLPFRMFKFRSMREDAKHYALCPLEGADLRITPVGRWLRRTSLDELPQLLNVLNGTMSLVGPRPEMPFIVKDYDDSQRQRLSVRPGITGLWQISRDRRSLIHEVPDYDLYYIRHRSIIMDLLILVRTLGAFFGGI